MFNLFNLLSTQSAESVSNNLIAALNILWKGMLAIVVVVGIVMGVTYLMQFISKKAADKKANAAEQENSAAIANAYDNDGFGGNKN